MPFGPDDTVCYCFHVPLRKIETFCAVEKPRHASQISECLSAGTGCGWCVPMIERIHQRICGDAKPWWRQDEGALEKPQTLASADQAIDAEAYRQGRQNYIEEGKGTPPPGAEV